MDPYAILGVPRGCSRDRVKEAFRTLVQRAHPDHGGNGEAFVRLCAAYRHVLAEVDTGDDPRDQDRPEHTPVGPVVPRADYVAWMRQVAAESARRKAAPWWRRHPRKARAGLLGLIGFGGFLALAAAIAIGTRSSDPPLGGRPEGARPSSPAGPRPSGVPAPLSRTGP